MGQSYLKPVGVFTNGRCYSACEIFAANMKDNKIATIFGEDSTTGGGGANAVQYSYFQDMSSYFPDVPFKNEMPLAALDFSLAWIQMIRINGQIIEDTGIKSDYIVRPTLSDIEPGIAQSSHQYDQIADILIQQSIVEGKADLLFEVEPKLQQSIRIGQPITLEFQTRGFKKIIVYDEDSKLIWTSSNVSSSSLTHAPVIGRPSIRRYNIQGLDGNANIAFNTWRSFKFVPPESQYYLVTTDRRNFARNLDFTKNEKYYGVYENPSKAGQGWNYLNNKWVINDGVTYGKNIDSTLSIFLANRGSSIGIVATYDTEYELDFLQIGYILNGENTHYLLPNNGVSGVGVIDQIFDLPAGNVEVFFRFYGHSGGFRVGATVQSIKLF